MVRRTRRLKGGLGTPTAPVNQTPLTPVGPVVPMFQNPIPQLPQAQVIQMHQNPLPKLPTPQAQVIQMPQNPIAQLPALPAPSTRPPRHTGPSQRPAVRPLAVAPTPKLIKQGSYGCLYRPSLKCGATSGVVQADNEVSKLMTATKAADELAEADKLKPIDPDQKYFVYSGKSCTVTVNAADPQINKCDAVRGRISAKLLIMPDGGIDLDDFEPSRKQYRATFLGMRNLLEGLQKLHDGGYAHYDIKPGNIVARMDGDVCNVRFVDFGLMRDHTMYPNDDYRYEYNYPWYCFEVKFLSTKYDPSISGKYWRDYRIQSLGYEPESRDNSVWTDPITKMIPTPSTTAGSESMYQSFLADKARVGSQILTLNDIFGLGRTLGQIYYRLTSQSPGKGSTEIYFTGASGGRLKLKPTSTPADLALVQLTQSQYDFQFNISKFSKIWFTMCETMMHPEPSKRMSLTDAITYFDSEIAPVVSTYFP